MRAFVPYRFVIVALAAALLLLTSSVSYATHLRPTGATPDLDALVISYKDCSPPGTHTHGMTGLPSCAPPTPTSQWLEVGDPVVNGNPANFIGSNRLDVCPVPGCAAPDVRFETKLQDVRCASAALPASVCPTGLH